MNKNKTSALARHTLALLAAAALSACANLAPSYQTPAAPVPDRWADAPASAGAGVAATPSAAQDWAAVMLDPQLRQVIALALEHNRDLRIATLSIEQARASYRIQAADQWPTVNAQAGASASRTPAQASSSGQAQLSRSHSLQVGLTAYEIDLFGRVANLKEAALQSYLNTEAAQRSTRLSLIAEVATAWLTLSADQAQLALARETLASQQQSLNRIVQSQRLGGSSALTVAQAQSTVESARLGVASYEAQLKQDRNALELLLGTALPAALEPPAQSAGTPAAASLSLPPAGLPSEVLRSRPDVLAAEHLLQAANANLGAARAARFPTISLTAAAGTASTHLSDLFKGGAWSFAPSLSLPLLDGGASQATVESAQATLQLQLATYEKTVQTAFREVADALAARSTLDQRLQAQQALVASYQRALQLSQARYEAGADSYLTVLDAQRSLFSAQQSLVSLRLAEQGNRITLFKVLGGAWTTAAAAAG